jgi:(p)ppGpp synthase/HD superfamily hydrolase
MGIDNTKTESQVLSQAIALAAQAHMGQVDKAGAPYILHPLRLMASMNGALERQVAVLHDVLEDSDTSVGDLFQIGLCEEVVDAVYTLTRQSGESYMDFIERVRKNPLAARVKIADLLDNMDLSRLPSDQIGPEDYARQEKYQKAFALLVGVTD